MTNITVLFRSLVSLFLSLAFLVNVSQAQGGCPEKGQNHIVEGKRFQVSKQEPLEADIDFDDAELTEGCVEKNKNGNYEIYSKIFKPPGNFLFDEPINGGQGGRLVEIIALPESNSIEAVKDSETAIQIKTVYDDLSLPPFPLKGEGNLAKPKENIVATKGGGGTPKKPSTKHWSAKVSHCKCNIPVCIIILKGAGAKPGEVMSGCQGIKRDPGKPGNINAQPMSDKSERAKILNGLLEGASNIWSGESKNTWTENEKVGLRSEGWKGLEEYKKTYSGSEKTDRINDLRALKDKCISFKIKKIVRVEQSTHNGFTRTVANGQKTALKAELLGPYVKGLGNLDKLNREENKSVFSDSCITIAFIDTDFVSDVWIQDGAKREKNYVGVAFPDHATNNNKSGGNGNKDINDGIASGYGKIDIIIPKETTSGYCNYSADFVDRRSSDKTMAHEIGHVWGFSHYDKKDYVMQQGGLGNLFQRSLLKKVKCQAEQNIQETEN